MNPDRLSIYNYAHMPTLFKPQRRIADGDLPEADTKLQILALAIKKLTEAGYVYIGMDHFAKPDDEMAIAQRQGRLHRNFQGYSTYADCDMLDVYKRQLMDAAVDALKSENQDDYLGQAETLLIMMQQHNMKEENMLYPMCDQHLSAELPAILQHLESNLSAA